MREGVGSWAVIEQPESPVAQTYTPGDHADFDRLYQATYPRVVRTVAGIVGSLEAAQDCAHDAYVRAYRAWADWRGEVPAEAWLYRIAVNTAISYRRREKIRGLPSLLWRLGAPDPGPDPAEHAQSRALLPELRRLPPKQAAALVFRYYHGFSNREIAAALGVSERTVGQRIADGLKRLRAVLGETAL